ncbi:MAG TPA: MBL fold metallo-hydrolase [Candidatus Acidoferrum sp.]|nr:MBL fold metallo-hydrolase [Candidatus Acidoferrum sp.]
MKITINSRLVRGVVAVLALGLIGTTSAQPQQDFSKVEIKTHKLADGFYYLEGSGGQIGVSVGDDGVFMVDAQYAQLTDKIIAAIKTLSDKPIRYLVNTHYHPDHVSGDANFAKAGVAIVAHQNLRKRLADGFTGNDPAKPLTAEQNLALPSVTYDSSMDFHFNGHDIHVFHVQPSHTDGDSMVYFKDLNIIMTGDVFRTVSYPRADVPGGGSVLGIMAVYKQMIAMSNDSTLFVPGHGDVSKRSDVQAQLKMLDTIRNRISKSIKAGKTLEQVQAEKPTAEFDARWSSGSVTNTVLVEAMYNELKAKK